MVPLERGEERELVEPVPAGAAEPLHVVPPQGPPVADEPGEGLAQHPALGLMGVPEIGLALRGGLAGVLDVLAVQEADVGQSLQADEEGFPAKVDVEW